VVLLALVMSWSDVVWYTGALASLLRVVLRACTSMLGMYVQRNKKYVQLLLFCCCWRFLPYVLWCLVGLQVVWISAFQHAISFVFLYLRKILLWLFYGSLPYNFNSQ
jgi:hypothetical protein